MHAVEQSWKSTNERKCHQSETESVLNELSEGFIKLNVNKPLHFLIDCLIYNAIFEYVTTKFILNGLFLVK